jgi:hypothetical protein
MSIPFISFNEGSAEFVLHDEAVKMLSNLPERVAVVAAAGPYRSGKSYLLNCLVGQGGCFGVGHQVASFTKGLWISSRAKAVQGADGRTIHAIFMDVEGFGATDQTSSHDSAVFVLVLLLCSCLIYNTRGNIDEQSIGNLALITELAKQVQSAATKGDADVDVDNADAVSSECFPSFIWMLRDFALELVDSTGSEMSADEYLETSLESRHGYDQDTLSQNRVRQMMRTFFGDRRCYTLVRPAEDEKALQALETRPFSELRPEFQDQFVCFERSLAAGLQAKTLRGVEINGQMLASLAQTYVSGVNEAMASGGAGGVEGGLGGWLCVDTAWAAAVQQQCAGELAAGLTRYETAMEEARQAALQQQAGAHPPPHRR